MKNLVYILAMLVSLPLFGQSKAIDDLFNRYAMQDGFVTVTVSKGALEILSALDQDKDLKILANSVSSIRILANEKSKSGQVIDFYKELLPSVPKNEYTELVHVRNVDQNVVMLVKQKADVIQDFLMIVGGKDNALISIQGNLDLNEIRKLSSTMPGSGLHHLEKIQQ